MEPTEGFRFRSGKLKGLPVSVAPTDYLEQTLQAAPSSSVTARACRAELLRRRSVQRQRIRNAFDPFVPIVPMD